MPYVEDQTNRNPFQCSCIHCVVFVIVFGLICSIIAGCILAAAMGEVVKGLLVIFIPFPIVIASCMCIVYIESRDRRIFPVNPLPV